MLCIFFYFVEPNNSVEHDSTVVHTIIGVAVLTLFVIGLVLIKKLIDINGESLTVGKDRSIYILILRKFRLKALCEIL